MTSKAFFRLTIISALLLFLGLNDNHNVVIGKCSDSDIIIFESTIENYYDDIVEYDNDSENVIIDEDVVEVEEPLINVEAYFYLNTTGKSSKYISCTECVEIGVGEISYDSSMDKLIIRNDPESVNEHLVYVPDYSGYIDSGESIQWMTIYRGYMIYRVIGEIVTYEEDIAETELEEFDMEYNSEVAYALLGSANVFEEETDDIILDYTSASKVFDTVSDMVKTDIPVGMNITTNGYYSYGDGGGAEYYVADSPSYIYESLENGLFANLVIGDSVNIKQLGAVGDGTTNEAPIFARLSYLEVNNVIIPEGIYDLKNMEVCFTASMSITGSSADNCIIKNLNLVAPYGLTLSNVTCDGGTTKTVCTPEANLDVSVMFMVSPIGGQSLNYSSCVFKNVDVVSFANQQNGYFERDVVSDCVFENIGRVAIYHSLDSSYTSYCNNTFSDIGSTLITSGPVSAIWIGDITNNTYTQSEYIEIRNNIFENLYTGNDFDADSKHALNANFIAIRGNKAEITGNTINNLIGFGNDREAVYSKVKDLIVDGNIISNGGTGEGYICSKGTSGESNCIITNNIITGEYGCGICSYSGTEIRNNVINIDYCKAAIISGSRSDQDDGIPVYICDNNIQCGCVGIYTYDGESIDSYSSGNIIKVISPAGITEVSGNVVYPGMEYTSYIAIGNARDSINVINNEINASGIGGTGISIYSTSKEIARLDQIVNVSQNKIYLCGGKKAVNINFVESGSCREIYYDENEVYFDNITVRSYPLVCSSNVENNDTLEISGNSANAPKSKMYIKYSVNTVYNNDDFAIVSKK